MTNLAATPTISVIMGCHNGEDFLDEAIQSIMDQTFREFEFIIIDDASADGSWEIIRRWQDNNPRIRAFRNDQNLGLAATLNKALTYARGRYIARMDADDISLPGRFARQLEVLDNSNVQICGTWIRSIGRSNSKVIRYPVSHDEICAHLYFQSAFAHPSVMLTADLYRQFSYHEESGIAEDYDLWARMSSHAVMANIPEVLLLYRVHKGQVSESGRLRQAGHAAAVRERYLEDSGMPISRHDVEIARQFRWPLPPSGRQQVLDTEQLLSRILDFHSGNVDYRRIIANEWYLYCIRASVFGLWTWRTFRSSRLFAEARPSLPGRMQLWLVCLFRLRFRSRLYNFLEQFSPG